MYGYIARRILLLPVTLFFIIIVNFVIINLAPGDPTTITEISPTGEAQRTEKGADVFGSDMRYLQFREHFGLTLPIILNWWPFLSQEHFKEELHRIAFHENDLPFREKQELEIRLGDQARFIMPQLVRIMLDEQEIRKVRTLAARFFVRGGTQQAYLGPNLNTAQRLHNRKVAEDNQILLENLPSSKDSEKIWNNKIESLVDWYEVNASIYDFEKSLKQKWESFFFETRLWRYLSRVVTLDFGTLRNDRTKTVISEVAKRFKYSLTLSLIPMCMTFVLCIVIGFTMALKQHQWQDYALNLMCLVLYAIPIFVVAPFLIEKVALHHDFPFTNLPIPIHGFTSPEKEYSLMTTWQRFWDIFRHITLPIVAILYGSLAAQSRLARTACLEVMRQDYVRTAYAKGLPPRDVITRHIGRNASITIVTAIAGSLGVILGGALIVETVFGINGFGRFFYEAVLDRDYNVIMFSALAGSFLSLIGYLLADIAYMLLDPRVSLE
ncbi:MAG: ABC transporter permease [Chlamydiales bacterium]